MDVTDLTSCIAKACLSVREVSIYYLLFLRRRALGSTVTELRPVIEPICGFFSLSSSGESWGEEAL